MLHWVRARTCHCRIRIVQLTLQCRKCWPRRPPGSPGLCTRSLRASIAGRQGKQPPRQQVGLVHTALSSALTPLPATPASRPGASRSHCHSPPAVHDNSACLWQPAGELPLPQQPLPGHPLCASRHASWLQVQGGVQPALQHPRVPWAAPPPRQSGRALLYQRAFANSATSASQRTLTPARRR